MSLQFQSLIGGRSQMIDVSIIIPVYNCEEYINRCIDSLINQTYKNFEILIINDGSTDGTLERLRQYEFLKFIKIFSQENAGPAVARNFGIKYAVGEYVMFIDSDDYVDEDFVESYILSIKEHNSDIVIGGYKRVVEGKIVSKVKLKNQEFSKYLITGPVCRIIKRNFLLDNDILFLDTNSSEDVYFNILIYNSTKKITIIDNTGYYYYFNSKSLSNTAHKGFKSEIKIIELLDFINLKDSYNLEMNQYFIIKYCIWYFLFSGRTATKTEFINENDKLFNWIRENIKAYKNNKYISLIRPSGEPLKHRFIIWIYMKIIGLNLVPLFARLYCKGE